MGTGLTLRRGIGWESETRRVIVVEGWANAVGWEGQEDHSLESYTLTVVMLGILYWSGIADA